MIHHHQFPLQHLHAATSFITTHQPHHLHLIIFSSSLDHHHHPRIVIIINFHSTSTPIPLFISFTIILSTPLSQSPLPPSHHQHHRIVIIISPQHKAPRPPHSSSIPSISFFFLFWCFYFNLF